MKLRSYGITDIGKIRKENQDSFLIDQDEDIYIIADGMGGLQDGAKASKFVVETIRDQIKEKLKDPETKNDVRFVIRAIRAAVNETNKNLKQTITSKTGSTLVLAVKVEKKIYITNVGDSIAYGVREDQIIQLTPEHNMAWMLVMMDKLTPEQAKKHPSRHSLTAYMGMNGQITSYVNIFKPTGKDKLLLCTDGLTGMVSEEKIVDVVNNENNIENAGKKLVKMANEAGGSDNITLILVETCEDAD